MTELNWFKRLLNAIFTVKLAHVDVYDNNAQKWVKVDAPVTFSELDEQFGEGNWKL